MVMVPKVQDLTVRQFMKCAKIFKSEDDLIDRYTEILSVLTGRPQQYFETIDTDLLKELFAQIPTFSLDGIKIKVNKKVFIKGKLFVSYPNPLEVTELKSDRYRDLKVFSEAGPDENLHNLLACVYSPSTWTLSPKKYLPKYHKVTAEAMLDAKIKDVCGLVFFYSDVFEKLKVVIEIYLEGVIKEVMSLKEA